MEFGFWILDFGFWILDFGFWILDFGFWSLDFGFWISLVFVLFVAAPNGGVWILDLGVWSLDFGVWILEFGFWIWDFGMDGASTDIVWILHKIFPCHADSGRRILDVHFPGKHGGPRAASMFSFKSFVLIFLSEKICRTNGSCAVDLRSVFFQCDFCVCD